MGGPIVQELAMSHPGRVRSMVLGCTGVLSADKPRGKKIPLPLFYVPVRWYAKRMAPGMYGPAADPAAVERDIAMLAKDPCNPRGVQAQSKALAGYATTLEAVAAIDRPALVLHGTADTAVPYAWGEELADTLSDARLVTFEGAGHSYFAADGDRANDEVLAFLAEVDSR
jgi:pimeloyl-ACP methyl ester carboxylesterase